MSTHISYAHVTAAAAAASPGTQAAALPCVGIHSAKERKMDPQHQRGAECGESYQAGWVLRLLSSFPQIVLAQRIPAGASASQPHLLVLTLLFVQSFGFNFSVFVPSSAGFVQDLKDSSEGLSSIETPSLLPLLSRLMGALQECEGPSCCSNLREFLLRL